MNSFLIPNTDQMSFLGTLYTSFIDIQTYYVKKIKQKMNAELGMIQLFKMKLLINRTKSNSFKLQNKMSILNTAYVLYPHLALTTKMYLTNKLILQVTA